MPKYNRLTKATWHDTKFANLDPRAVLYRLWELENEIAKKDKNGPQNKSGKLITFSEEDFATYNLIQSNFARDYALMLKRKTLEKVFSELLAKAKSSKHYGRVSKEEIIELAKQLKLYTKNSTDPDDETWIEELETLGFSQLEKDTVRKVLQLIVPDCASCEEDSKSHVSCLCLRATLAEQIRQHFNID